MIKRWRARARGRSARIRKRTCHITLTLVPGRRQRSRARAACRRGEAEAHAAPQGRSEGQGRDRDRGCRGQGRGRPKPKAQQAQGDHSEEEDPPRRKRATLNGPESPSRRDAHRCHPRLEVELVHRHEGVPRGAARGHQDPRAHLQQAVARGPLRRPDPQGQAADHDRHLHRSPGNRHRKVRCRGGRAPQRDPRHDPQERPHQHQRDQAPRARREARRAVDRRAAPEPGQLPARDEALARLGDALGRPRA